MSPQRPLRIVHVAGTPIGAPWMIALAREQKRLDHDVAVIIPSLDGNIAPALAAAGIPCHTAALDVMSARGILGKARVIFDLVRLLRKLRPDVVHGHLLPSVVTARIASWIADVPIRFGANAGPLTLESEVLRAVEIGTAFCDTRTIASCTYTHELFVKYGIPETQLELIYYAVDHSGFDPALADGARVRRELGIDDGAPLVGLVAYFYPPSHSYAVYPPHLVGRGLKGHEVLLHAVPRVLEAFPNAKFALVGSGWGPPGPAYEQSLRDLAKGLGIADAVLFTGERSDIPDTLSAFDVSVHPSLNDNVGGTVESLLMARPFVASDIRGYADTVLHEKTGLVVPAGDSTALADAIIRLLRDPDLARTLGENGRRRMLERFTLSRVVADTEALLAKCSGRAEEHYRIPTMLGRTFVAPWRLLPVALGVRRVMRRHHPRRRFSRVKSAVRKIVKSSAPTGNTRIAQIAAAWENCEWFTALCRDLTARGYDVIAIIDAEPGDLGIRLAEAGIRTYKVKMTFATGLDRARLPAYIASIPMTALKIARILRREKIDVVHSHIFASVVVSRLAATLARARHVAGIAGPRHLEAPLTRAVDRWTWWLDDATLAGCRHTRDLYMQLGANEDRLDTVYYGADASRFDPALADGPSMRRTLGIAADAPLVVLVGHFYPPTRGAQTPPHTIGRGPKGHDDFLAAARIIVRTIPAARFVLAGGATVGAGETYRKRLIAECRDDELLRDRVIFTGHIGDVPSLLAAADVAVQCSLTENLGGTIEALLMERPVVATRVGGMPESVRDGETGLLVPPSDPAALAAAILRLLQNRDEAAAFARAGRRLMLDRFTSARTADDVDAVYRRLNEWSAGALAGASRQS
jgi:glycosyltransferase involved in cell wall biosynthesis